jgi:gliding motility-associated-like protein
VGYILRNLIYILVFLASFDAQQLRAQCTFNKVKPIYENGFFGVKSIVSGATNNILGSNGQGVCKVNLHFQHELVGDLRIRLISPSGQSVILVGPPVLASVTTGTDWNIGFVRCSASANPDLSFNPTWKSNNLWGQNKNYTGTYHPPSGQCLENFNTGTVNGVWELEILDNYALSAGELLGFSIEFCDNSGISCNSCEASSGAIPASFTETCAGDPALNLNLSPTYREPNPNAGIFGYKFIITDGAGIIVSVANTADLRNFSAGLYMIYGFSYSLSDAGQLPSPNGVLNLATFSQRFSGSNPSMCGDLTDVFESVLIRGSTAANPVLVRDTICKGEVLTINGQNLSTTGTFTLNLKTSNNCDSIVSLNLVVLDMVANVAAPNLVTCANNIITLNGGGSTGGNASTYRWETVNGFFQGNVSGPIFANPINVEGVGTYSVTVTLAGCTATTSVTVLSDNSLPNIIGSDRNFDCINPNNITLSVSTNATNPSFAWTGPGLITNPNSANPIVSSVGTYTLRVTSMGCTISKKFIVSQDLAQPTISILTNPYKCESDTVKLDINSNVGNLSYNWQGPNGFVSNIKNPINIGPGIYKVTITAANGCTNDAQVNYTPTLPLPNLTINGRNIDCAEVSIDITASSLTPSVTYAWYSMGSFISSNSILTNITNPGSFVCIVNDLNNCKKVDTFRVSMDTIRPSLMVTGGLIACNQDSIRIFANYSPINSTIFWSGNNYGESGASADFFEKGSYTVTAIARNGCAISSNISIDFAPNKPILTLNPDTITCLKPNITLNPTSNMPMVTWAWTGPLNQVYNVQNPVVNSPGTYRLKATAINGCHSVINTEISKDIGLPYIRISFDSITCSKDSALLRIDTLEANAYFRWNLLNGDSLKVKQFYTKIGGNYSLNLIGRNGCLVDTTLAIFVDTLSPFANITSSGVGCLNTPSRINLSTNIPVKAYNWSNSLGYNSNLQNPTDILAIGDYNISLVGVNGCTNNQIFNVGYDTIVPKIEANGGLYKCSDPNFTLDVVTTGQVQSYFWTGPGGYDENFRNPKPTGPGLYQVLVKFLNGCEVIDTAMVIPFDSIPSLEISTDTLSCSKPNIALNITTSTNTLSYNWVSGAFSSNQRNPTISVPGIYLLTVTDNTNQCTSQKGVTITIDTMRPYFTLNSATQLTCQNPSINTFPSILYPSGSYEWSSSGNVISMMPETIVGGPGVYTLKITLPNGCVETQSQTFVADTLKARAVFATDTLTCSKSKAEIIPNIDLSDVGISWSGPDNYTSTDSIALVLLAGTYTVTITNNDNSCPNIFEVNVVEDRIKPALNATGGTLRCDTRTLQLKIDNLPSNSSVAWFGPQMYISTNASPTISEIGQYVVQVTPPNGCQAEDTIFVDDNFILPQINIASNGSLSCSSPTMTLERITNSNISSLQWSGPGVNNSQDSIITISIPGAYMVSITDVNGCKSSASISVPGDSLKPRFVFKPSNQIRCESKSFQLLLDSLPVGANYSYQWAATNNGNITGNNIQKNILANGAGRYEVTVTNRLNGCKTFAYYDAIPVPSDLTAMNLEFSSPNCSSRNSGVIRFLNVQGGTPPYLYSLQTSIGYSSNTFYEYLRQGTYNLSIKDKDGCRIDSTVILTQQEELNISLTADKYEIYLGDSVLIDLNINRNWAEIANYAFIPDSIACLPCNQFYVKPLKTTNYIFTAIDTNGCTSNVRIKIFVNGKYDVFVPNIFTPNGDGINDDLIIGGDLSIEQVNFFEIYNRWGGLLTRKENFVLEGNVPVWDGKFHGTVVQPGVYTYLMEIQQDDGYTSMKAGTITVYY